MVVAPVAAMPSPSPGADSAALVSETGTDGKVSPGVVVAGELEEKSVTGGLPGWVAGMGWLMGAPACRHHPPPI